MSASPVPRARLRFARLGPRHGFTLGAMTLLGAATVSAGGCAQQTVEVPTRSLERSGRVSFICLDNPLNGPAARPLSDCTVAQVSKVNDYAVVDEETNESTPTPHLYALVTQTTRGEIAVVDTTAATSPILDQDPGVPGANFLPIGAQPVDIVSTEGGMASFVGVAEVGREAIFALPSSRLRPASTCPEGSEGTVDKATDPDNPCVESANERPPPMLSDWPACALPAAPGQMLILEDPLVAGEERVSCDSAHAPPDPNAVHPNGDLRREGRGRQKIVVTMPTLGGIAIFDAQSILDRTPGSFDPCVPDRWIPLEVNLPALALPPPLTGPACVGPPSALPAYAPPYSSRPLGISYAEGRLYASDLDAPVVHVIDLPTPCEPLELEPLLPRSVDKPERVVTTTRLSVMPSQTPELNRYLYAIDSLDGSVMAFDVGDAQSSRFPLERVHPEWSPFGARDRIQIRSPVADVLIVDRDRPERNPITDVLASGIACDPNPALKSEDCSEGKASCDPGTLYRTSGDYTSGASPLKLRGTFGFLALTSGYMAVVDIDDLDAPCRVPPLYSELAGCFDHPPNPDNCDPRVLPRDEDCLKSSYEISCNIVLPNTLRSSTFFTPLDGIGQRVPGIANPPLLFRSDGAIIPTYLEDGASRELNTESPIISATLPKDYVSGSGDLGLFLWVSGQAISITEEGLLPTETGIERGLAMNFEDPRPQIEQDWTVTWEGGLGGFTDKRAALRLDSTTGLSMVDANSRFCDFGVQSEASVRTILMSENVAQDVLDEQAKGYADYVQLLSALPVEEDAYWNTLSPTCAAEINAPSPYDECRRVFGTLDAVGDGRDLRVTEAYQDHLELEPRAAATFGGHDFAALTKCCFPTEVSFKVRTGKQWAVLGSGSGFLHHVIPDPQTGACRNSCDPAKERLNARVRMAPLGDVNTPWPVVRDGDRSAFINPMFRFAIHSGYTIEPGTPPRLVAIEPTRDTQFSFSTVGQFLPLAVNLAPDEKTLVQPVGMSFIPATGEIAVTDGALNGLVIVGSSGVGVGRRYF